MSQHNADTGPDPKGAPEKAEADMAKTQAKKAAADAEREAEMAQQRAEDIEDEAKEHTGKAAPAPSSKETPAKEVEVVEQGEYMVKAKPALAADIKEALAVRADKKAKQPTWRRQEWFRYKKLGGKNAGWRSPRGMHSKMRMHLKYRPNVVSIGYRGPAASRGLHPSGFEEVLVYRPEDLEAIDAKTQAARVGGTVGGRKAELIEKKADDMGIRVLNRRN